MQGCAYAGTGNVLKVQQFLSICSDHLEDKNAHQVAHGWPVAALLRGVRSGVCERTRRVSGFGD